MTLFKCQITKVDTSVYAISADIIFGKVMNRDFNVQFYVELLPIAVKMKKLIRFVDINMNMCDALSTKFDMPLVQKIVIEIRRTGNIPFQCPFNEVLSIHMYIFILLSLYFDLIYLLQNFLYTIYNFTFSDKYFINIMPHVNFVTGMDFYSTDVMIGNMKANGKIVPKVKGKQKN